jgi:hypothetical protein
MINTKLCNKALKKMRTLWCCCYFTDCYEISWCSVHLTRFGDRYQVKRGTGNSWVQNDGTETRKHIAHIPTDYCTLKLTIPHGLSDCRVPVDTASLYDVSMEEIQIKDNPGQRWFQLCVLVIGTTQPPYSWNDIWHLNRGWCGKAPWIFMIPLASWPSVCQWQRKVGLQQLSLCAAVDILR